MTKILTKGKKVLACFLAVLLTFGSMTGQGAVLYAKQAETLPDLLQEQKEVAADGGDVMELLIDGESRNVAAQTAYRGIGTVTCNNSSRLLMDYKEEHPDIYWEIMNWLFHPEKGAGLSHVKIELGSDADSSSGAEPATKRSEEEPANVKRGAGFMFAHDALTINPEITVDLLCWGKPAWVSEAENLSQKKGFEARYRWYKETIDAAYDDWGIQFDYVSANQNEKMVEVDWTIYLSEALKNETDERYDYGSIKIVSADETDTMRVATNMLENEAFCNAVDVIGCHYNSYMNESVLKLNEEYGKEIWFSEGASVATDTIFGNNTTSETSTSGTNGMLDIANRIVIGYAMSNMTMYEFQPSVAAYYDGSVYYPKQLIAANHPWSGYYEITAGIPMTMHFTSFMEKGWQYVTSGCYGDGKQSNHYITETTNNYLTAADSQTGDYSTVLTNDSATERKYKVTVKNLAKAGSPVYVWETATYGSGESYDAHWLEKTGEIAPVAEGDGYTYEIAVAPFSMMTITTTTGQHSYAELKKESHCNENGENTSLALPYSDDFEYEAEYVERRGGTPRYTTDLNGAFEVVKLADGNQVLQQKIDVDIYPSAWGGTTDPITSLGDDTWRDYSVSIDACFDEKRGLEENYVGIACRYNAVNSIAKNGYYLKVYAKGTWELSGSQGVIADGTTNGCGTGKWMNLKLSVLGNRIRAYINGEEVADEVVEKSLTSSGRVAILSDYYHNYYDNLKVEPIESLDEQGTDCVTRVDDLENALTFSDKVIREQSLSYKYYGRTLSSMQTKNDTLSFQFEGTGFSLLGNSGYGAKLEIIVDGNVVEKGYKTTQMVNRAVYYQLDGLTYGTHTVLITLKNKNELEVDAVEIFGKKRTPVSSATESIVLSVRQGEAVTKLADTDVVTMNAFDTCKIVPELTGTGTSDIIWKTSNADAAVVLSDGTLVANGGGTAVITACSNGKEASFHVEVTQLKITPGSGIVLAEQQTQRISAELAGGINESEITGYRSEDSSIAEVDENGMITAKKKGVTCITVTAANGVSGTVAVIVKKAPSRIRVDEKKVSLREGKKTLIYTEIPKGSLTKITFRSNKEKIATVTKKGKIEAKKVGKCKITVTTHNGKKAVVKVTVKPAKKKKK